MEVSYDLYFILSGFAIDTGFDNYKNVSCLIIAYKLFNKKILDGF